MIEHLEALPVALKEWATHPNLILKFGLVIASLALAYGLSASLKKLPWFSAPKGPEGGGAQSEVRRTSHLLFPLLSVVFLGMAIRISEDAFDRSWLVRIVQSLVVIYLLHTLVIHYVRYRVIEVLFKWAVAPIAVIYVLGFLDEVSAYLDTMAIRVGTIRISMLGLIRTMVLGSLLFWLGRISNSVGQRLIRRQEDIDTGTREVFAKLFQLALVTAFFLLLLRLLGVNLTALTVFGGALGVGLGFGLQSIASNFLSGIIILMDRSIKIGDYVELEDGVAGRIREISMRSTCLQTYDNKDVMVPNDQFITARFVNWTHNDEKQRYALTFQVAYDTDIPAMLDLVKYAVRSHPKVLNDPKGPEAELADAEISGFGESGVDILVEFWMRGIDDGENRVGADLYLIIWQTLEDNGIKIPYPRRDISILEKR